MQLKHARDAHWRVSTAGQEDLQYLFKLISVEFDGSGYSDEVFYYRIEAYPYVGTGKFTKVAF